MPAHLVLACREKTNLCQAIRGTQAGLMPMAQPLLQDGKAHLFTKWHLHLLGNTPGCRDRRAKDQQAGTAGEGVPAGCV